MVGLATLSASRRPREDSGAGVSGGWGEEEIEGPWGDRLFKDQVVTVPASRTI